MGRHMVETLLALPGAPKVIMINRGKTAVPHSIQRAISAGADTSCLPSGCLGAKHSAAAVVRTIETRMHQPWIALTALSISRQSVESSEHHLLLRLSVLSLLRPHQPLLPLRLSVLSLLRPLPAFLTTLSLTSDSLSRQSLNTHSHCSSFCSACVMELGSTYKPSSA